MKYLKFPAMFLGAIVLIVGYSSCKKDKEKGIECCTYTYSYHGKVYSYKACEDGTFTYTYPGGTYSEKWDTDTYSWSEFKQTFIYYFGGSCD